jgi:hypothetical protein
LEEGQAVSVVTKIQNPLRAVAASRQPTGYPMMRLLLSYSPDVTVTRLHHVACPHCTGSGWTSQFAFDAVRLVQAIVAFAPYRHFSAGELIDAAKVRMHPEYLRAVSVRRSCTLEEVVKWTR